MPAEHHCLDVFELMIAARDGNVDQIREVTCKGAIAHAAYAMTGWTPLHEACLRGHSGVIKEFMRLGVPWNEPSRCGRTPFLVACEKGQEAVVQLMLEKGVDPNQAVAHSGDTALHRVFMTCRNLRIAQRLLDAGADLQRENKTHEHVMQSVGESLKSLEYDLDMLPNRDSYKPRALRQISTSFHLNEAETRFFVYLAFYKDAMHKGYASPDTIADVLGGFGYHDVCFPSMLEKREELGKTMLEAIEQLWGRHVADAFFRICARAFIYNARLCPSQQLRSAASRGDVARFHGGIKHLERVAKVPPQNLNAAAANAFEVTPLHCACQYGQERIMVVLLDGGADLWAETSSGQTPLSLASRAGHLPIIQEILRRILC